VCAPAEWADTLTLFHLYQYMHSVRKSSRKNAAVRWGNVLSPNLVANVLKAQESIPKNWFLFGCLMIFFTYSSPPQLFTSFIIYCICRKTNHRVRRHAPSIRSHRGTKVVWPDIQPMRVPEEPVCIDLFRQKPVFTSLHLKYPVHVVPPQNSQLFVSTLFRPYILNPKHFSFFYLHIKSINVLTCFQSCNLEFLVSNEEPIQTWNKFNWQVRERTDWKNKKCKYWECYSTQVSFYLVANLCTANLTLLYFQTDIELLC
jgi:hypothetical protein